MNNSIVYYTNWFLNANTLNVVQIFSNLSMLFSQYIRNLFKREENIFRTYSYFKYTFLLSSIYWYFCQRSKTNVSIGEWLRLTSKATAQFSALFHAAILSCQKELAPICSSGYRTWQTRYREIYYTCRVPTLLVAFRS